jgi:hypothetical protein
MNRQAMDRSMEKISSEETRVVAVSGLLGSLSFNVSCSVTSAPRRRSEIVASFPQLGEPQVEHERLSGDQKQKRQNN